MRRPILWLLVGSFIAAPASGKDYRAPRLNDGQVDLQGVWSHTNMTPLERPAELKTLVISAAEAAQIEAKSNAKSEDLSRPNEPALYFDKRTVVPIRGELRSSIIIEPANGKIPSNDHFKQLARRRVLPC